MTTIILPQAAYDALVDRLVAAPEMLGLKPCWFSGNVERYQAEFDLGAYYDIWPERVRASLERFDDPIELPAFLAEYVTYWSSAA